MQAAMIQALVRRGQTPTRTRSFSQIGSQGTRSKGRPRSGACCYAVTALAKRTHVASQNSPTTCSCYCRCIHWRRRGGRGETWRWRALGCPSTPTTLQACACPECPTQLCNSQQRKRVNLHWGRHMSGWMGRKAGAGGRLLDEWPIQELEMWGDVELPGTKCTSECNAPITATAHGGCAAELNLVALISPHASSACFLLRPTVAGHHHFVNLRMLSVAHAAVKNTAKKMHRYPMYCHLSTPSKP